MAETHFVFLSYSSKDKEIAEKVSNFLESNDISCWIAPRDIKPGVNYPAQIIGGIRNCKVFVLLATEYSNASEHVSNEVERAFDYKKMIVPFMLQNIQFSDELLYFLARKQQISAYQDLDVSLNALMTTIQAYLKSTVKLSHMPASDEEAGDEANTDEPIQNKAPIAAENEAKSKGKLQKVLTDKMRKSSYLNDNYYERECITSHFRLIDQSPCGLHIFSIDQTVNIATIFYHEINKSVSNNKMVLWLSSQSEFDDYIPLIDAVHVSNDHEGITLYIDAIKNANELTVLLELTRSYENFKICTSISKTIENNINSSTYPDAIFYEINAIEDRELDEIITRLCQEKDYVTRKKFLDIFRLPVNNGFRSPVLVINLISGIKSEKYVLHSDDPLALFQVVEQYFENIMPSYHDFYAKLADAILESKINIIPLNKLNGFDDEIKTFCSLDILKKTKMGLGFINLDYCHYIIASRYLEMGGGELSTNLRGFLTSSIPFFIKLQNVWFPGNLLIDECEKCKEKDKLVYLFLNDHDALTSLFLLDGFQHTMLDIVKHSTETASYDISEKLLSLFEENTTMDKTLYPRFCAERMYLNFFKNGDILNDEEFEESHYLHYKGFIKYCTDKYRESIVYFERAINITDSTDTYHKQIILDYIKALIDFGDLIKAKEYLSKIDPTSLTLKEQALMNNLKGELYKIDIDFESSEHAFNLALNAAYAIYDKRELAKTHGNLSELYTYWGKYDKAEEHIKSNILFSYNCHDYNGISISHQLLANLLLNKGIYNEAFENFSYSSYFAHAADNHWRYYHSLLYLNLFSGFEHQDVMDMENKIMAIDSTQYYASSYFIMALIAARESLNKAQEYLDKALNYAHTIGNELVCVLAKYFLGIIDNNQMNDTLPSDIQKYGKGLTSLIKGLISNSTDSPMNPKCLLPFYKYQEIEGERINLVYLAENDVHDIFDYASLDLPTRFVMWTKHKTVNDTIAYIHQTREMEKKGILYVWGIRTKSNNQIIGTIELNYNLKEDAAEFGIIISNKFWMSGYATESLKLIIDFCKSKLKLCRIIGICFTVNQRSSKLMKNNGFIFEKTIPDYHDKSNIPDKSGALYSLILINE